MRITHFFSLLIVSLFTSLKIYPQCMMVPVDLNQRVANSATIILGKLKEQIPYYSINNRVYTSNIIEVTAYLKGYFTNSTIIVISEGGIIDNYAEIVYPSLEIDNQHEFILMLIGDNTEIDNKLIRITYPDTPQMEAYACSQGMLKYQDGLYYDLLSESPQTESNLFQKIKRLSGQNPITPKGEIYLPRTSQNNKRITASNTKGAKITAITSVSPSPGIAGTINISDQITISGSGFGAVQGTVEFSFADDGGATYIQSPIPTTDIISWADNQIVMKVPRRAGTGNIRVNGTFTTAFSVDYSHIEINSSFSGFGSSTRQRYFLVNKDGSGGQSFQYNTGFATNAPAVAAFERALATWRCNTFVNFSVNPTTTTTAVVANDGENVVFFDPSLPAGVLGRATSQNSATANGACNLQNTVWYNAGIDIQFQDPPTAGYTWNYGPGASIAFGTTYDFESVALHELGHAHGLGHIIATGKAMHYALFNGQDSRTLDPISDIAGGVAKMNYSTNAANYCIQYPAGVVGPMLALNGGSCALSATLLSFKGKNIHPTLNELEWTTTDEINNLGFELSKSDDGIKFDSITFIKAKNNTNQNFYTYSDYSVNFKSRTYYKLAQIGQNGQKTIFPILIINESTSNSVIVYYEQNENMIYAKFPKTTDSDTEWALYNTSGQLIFKQKIPTDTTQKINLPLAVTSGIYYYTVKINNQKIHGKISIQR